MYSAKKHGWYAYLSSKEQELLNNPSIFISENAIPDNLIAGVSRNEMTNFGEDMYEDIQNCRNKKALE